MADFEAHIKQAKSNIYFLDKVDSSISNCWDWKVTVCFYVAVHLMNSHLAKKTTHNYRTHIQVDDALNPLNPLSLTKIDEPTYLAYVKLKKLSRRSRYIIHQDDPKSTSVCMTFDKHFMRAIMNLNIVMEYINSEYNIVFSEVEIDCIEIKSRNFKYFKYKKAVQLG